MTHHPPPPPDRYFWTVAATLSTLLMIGLLILFFGSCTARQPERTGPVAPLVDTTRQRLQDQARAAQATAKRANQRTYQTQQPYENAVRQYDSLRKQLPR